MQALESRGFSVWWDDKLRVGRWDHSIEAELERAKCVLVLWSRHSIKSRHVLDEADVGSEREVLVPLLVDDSRPPLGHRRIQASSFARWASGGDGQDVELARLLEAIRVFIPANDPIIPESEKPTQRLEVRRVPGLLATTRTFIDLTQLPRLLPVVSPLRPQELPLTAEERARWTATIEECEREAKAAGNVPEAAALYVEIGRIRAEYLGEASNAASAFHRAYMLNDRDLSAISAFRPLFTQAANWGVVAQLLRAEIDATSDKQIKATLLSQLGAILEDRSARRAEAEGAYRKALELWSAEPLAVAALQTIRLRSARLADLHTEAMRLELEVKADPANLHALARLEHLSAAREDWARAAQVAEQRARSEPDPFAYAALHIRIANIKETKLKEPGAEHHRLALELVPDHPIALRSLELTYRQLRDWEALAAFYPREAMVTADRALKAELYVRAADILANRLQRNDAAADLLAQALALAPTSASAHHAKRRLAQR